MRSLAMICLLAASRLAAQPQISNRGIVNAASAMPAALPSGAIARGSFFSIYGNFLGPDSSPPVNSYPLQTNLGGVSVKVSQGSTTVDAFPYFVSPSLINAIMPSNAPLGNVLIAVTRTVSGATIPGAPASARVVNSSFGIFTFPGAFGPAFIQNFQPNGSVVLNSASAPAKPGQVVILYGTGLGPVSFSDGAAPTPGNLPVQVDIFVGGKRVAPQYAGRSTSAAEDQINFQLPGDVPVGCWVPVQLRTEGTTVSNTATMAISADGSPCTDPLNPLTQPLISGKKVGLFAILRSSINQDVGLIGAGDVATDAAMIAFQETWETWGKPGGNLGETWGNLGETWGETWGQPACFRLPALKETPLTSRLCRSTCYRILAWTPTCLRRQLSPQNGLGPFSKFLRT